MAENAGSIIYTASFDLSELLSGEKKIISAVQNAKSAIQKADAEVESFKNGLSQLGKTVSSTNQVITSFGRVDQQATRQLALLTAQAKLARYQANGIGTSMSRTASATARGARTMRGGLSNVSYQLQDVIVQAQMGTSYFTILAQQGPQLAMSFGRFGPQIGIALALVGALAPAVISLFKDGEDAAGNFETAVDNVNAAVTLSADGTGELTDAVQRLARYSKNAAAQMLVLAQSNALVAQQQAAEKLEQTYNGLYSSLSSYFTGVNDQTAQATEKLININALAKEMNIAPGTDVSKQFAEAQSRVTALKTALDNLKSNQSVENIDAVVTALNALKVNGKFTTQASQKLAVQVFKMADAILKGKDASELLNKSLKGLNSGGGLSKIVPDALPDKISSMNDELAILETRMNEGDQAAENLKAKMDAVAASKGMSPDQVNKNVIAWTNLVNVISETTKTANKLKSLDSEHQKLTSSLQTLTLAEKQDNAVKALGTNATEEQIQKVKDLVAQNEELSNQKKGVSIANNVKTSSSVTTDYQTDTSNLQDAYDNNLVSYQQYIAAKKQLDANYAEQYLATQSTLSNVALTAVNSLASGAVSAFASIASGSSNVEDAMKSLAQTIIQSVLQSLIQTAVQYEVLPVLAEAFGAAQIATDAQVKTAQATTAAAHTAAVSAQVTETASLAAANAYAATAAIPLVGPAAAPAAATVAATAATSLGAAAISAAPVAGMRRYGGTVSSGNLYGINESGTPEVYSSGNSDYLMATSNAKVTPLSDYASNGMQANISVNNYASDTVSSTVSQNGNNINIDVISKQVASNLTSQVNRKQGSFYKSIKSTAAKKGK